MPPRQKSAPSWQRAYSGIATTCEVSILALLPSPPLCTLHYPITSPLQEGKLRDPPDYSSRYMNHACCESRSVILVASTAPLHK